MKIVKALFFDVGGTVFDWKTSACQAIEGLAQTHNQTIDSETFAWDWRSEMFKARAEVSQGQLPWMNADGMHLRALEILTPKYPLLEALDDPMSLVKETWHQLHTFPGAPEGINQLRSRYTVVVLTILSWESVVNSSKRANVQWDGILSCEFLGYYKPSRQAYLKGISLLGLTPDESMMVAAHPADLAAAQSAGMHTAYVNVPEEDIVFAETGQSKPHSFDIEAEDYTDLCEQLGIDI